MLTNRSLSFGLLPACVPPFPAEARCVPPVPRDVVSSLGSVLSTVVVSTAFSAAVSTHSVVFNAVGVLPPFHPPPEVPGLAAFVVSLDSAPLDVARVDDSFIDPLSVGEDPGPRFPSWTHQLVRCRPCAPTPPSWLRNSPRLLWGLASQQPPPYTTRLHPASHLGSKSSE
jgi:hypothetical protein